MVNPALSQPGARASVLLAICLAACLLPVHLRLAHYAEDDAYIHVRIATNLLHHGRPYFNVQDPVNASSSPVWTLLVTMLLGLTGDRLWSISVWNGLISAAGAVVHSRLLRRLILVPEWVPWVFGACYLAVTLSSSIGLMETPLALLLVGLAAHMMLDGRRLGFVALGLAVFVRYECALLAVLAVTIGAADTRPRDRMRLIAMGAAPLVAYELLFFGSLVPQSVIAKKAVYRMPLWDPATFTLVVLTAALALAFFLKMARESRLEGRLLDALLVFGAGVLFAYTASGTIVFPWYEPLFTVPFLYGVCWLLFCWTSRSRVMRMAFRTLAGFVAAWWIARLGATVLLAPVLSPVYYSGFERGARARQYVQIGEALYRHFPAATLLTSEIGGLGYGFSGYIADGAGLISPNALKYHPMKVPEERSNGTIGAIPSGYVAEVNPELIVSHEIFVEAFRRSPVAAGYAMWTCSPYTDSDLVQSQRRTIWKNSRLFVFVRRDLRTGAPLAGLCS